MDRETTMHAKLMSLGILVLGTCFQTGPLAETVGVFSDTTIGQINFAANDIKSALQANGFTVEMFGLSTLTTGYANKKVVIALSSNNSVTSLLTDQGGTQPTSLGEQAYALRTTTAPQKSYWVLGGDVNGAMYGGLEIAENIKFNQFTTSPNSQESPSILKRGIKLNLPWDKENPTYGKDDMGGFQGTSFQNAIPNVWDMTFWSTWFDEMARHRYNTVSLWSCHPFTSLIKLEGYEDVAIQDVTGFNGFKKTLTMDQKIKFWQDVMAYAHARGFEFLLFNWNVFTYGATGKHGITASPSNAATETYMYKSMYKLLETYPDFDGFGMSIGENGGTESFSWKTYGKAIHDYAVLHPQRKLRFIHRLHYAGFAEMKSLFGPLINNPATPNVTFDLSLKYSQAHMYSTPVPGWFSSEKQTILDNKLKTWYTVRNDDMYYLNWGDVDFARTYVKGMLSKPDIFIGFYMGSDGYSPTRTFFSKNSVTQGSLEVQRQQYMNMLWGRLAYNPNTSDEVFKNYLATKYPAVSSNNLFNAWRKGSKGIQIMTELVQGTWSLDFHWWPEACMGSRGSDFRTIGEMGGANPASGSNLCSIDNSSKANCGAKKSAYQVADSIESGTKEALSLLSGMSSGANTELGVNLNNIKALSYIGLYYAEKIRGATYLKATKKDSALKVMGRAQCYWMSYANLMDGMFMGMTNQRTNDLANWHALDAKVLKEYTDLGGSSNPSCATVGIETPITFATQKLEINSLTNNALFCRLPANANYVLEIHTIEGKKLARVIGKGAANPGQNGESKISLGTLLSKGTYIVELRMEGASAVQRLQMLHQ
jgi:hypothetical protein